MSFVKLPKPKVKDVSIQELSKKFNLNSNSIEVFINGVSNKSKEINENELFIALPGEKTHGAKFVPEAVINGAKAVLTDSIGAELIDQNSIPVLVANEVQNIAGEISAYIYENPSQKMDVFGITGTNGKTTTAWLLKAGLENCGIPTGLLGTAGIDIPGFKLESERTTPEATELQKIFALAYENGAKVISMEVSSHALTLGRVNGTRFKAVGFTNLSQDHLDFHKNMQDYFEAKSRLFNVNFTKDSIITTNDSWGKKLAEIANINVERLGGDVDDYWRVTDITAALGHVDFKLAKSNKQNFNINLSFAGGFNAFNASLAIALANKLDIDILKFIEGLENIQIPGRMQPVLVPGAPLAIIDYAHTPEAIENVLSTLRKETKGKLITIFGAGGNRDKEKRSKMGSSVDKYSDLIIVTDDNPRDEKPEDIRKSVISGILDKNKVLEIGNRKESIQKAISIAEELDTIAVLGKGHENYQEIKGEVFPFSDYLVTRELMEEKYK
ncbi:MAG: UDP-N-acetylmuramoyl-L-alanyl-D-glutamate--2,6-diaminopimelate ligase [Candidatus Nanopelagicales bacterium]